MCGCAASAPVTTPPGRAAPFPHVPEESVRGLMDGWASALTGIGDPNQDKRLSHKFSGCAVTYEEIADLWRRDDIAAKAIEAPTTEAFREGYELSIPDEQRYSGLKEQISEKLEELDVDRTLERAYQYHRAYGGAAILIGANDKRRLDQPLDTARPNLQIDYLNTFEPIEIEPAANYDDPFKPKYGRPQWYKLTGTRGMSPNDGPKPTAPPSMPAMTYIHESRLIVFEGIKTSNYYLPMRSDISPFWGEGIVPRFIETLRDCGVSYAGAGMLATDISQPVISIEGLKEMVGKNEDKLRARMRAVQMSRSVARAILIDSKEKFERQTTSLTGIPDLLDRLSQRLAAAVNIPLSVLFGYSPASLGTPDNKELELWYNQVRNLQRRELTPPLRMLIKMIMRSVRQRKIPTTWELKWKDLEHMTVAERAEMGLTVARRDSLDIKSGMLYPDEGRKSRWVGGYSIETQINEKKQAPGFIAPLPAGLIPKADPANGVVSAMEAKTLGLSAGSGAVGAAAHTVGGYTRRNPAQSGTEPAPKVGGDAATARGDGAVAPGNISAADEVAYQKAILAQLLQETPGKTSQHIELVRQLIAIAEAEAANCASSACGSDCVYAHPSRADEDGVGNLVNFAGFPVVVESPKGSTRTWVDTDGTEGSTPILFDYGYIPGSIGADGDSVDVYLGPAPGVKWVYSVHQMSKDSGFTVYDEDKAMLGFASPDAAQAAYLAQYNDPRFFGGMSMMSVDAFRQKVFAGAGMVAHGDTNDDLEREVDEHLAKR